MDIQRALYILRNSVADSGPEYEEIADVLEARIAQLEGACERLEAVLNIVRRMVEVRS